MDINQLHANFYRAFEEKFRGSRDTILSRLGIYDAFLNDAFLKNSSRKALDLGCGRGEWLESLTSKGFDALGVDLDDAMLSACREKGLNVLHADALAVLSAQTDSSLSVVSGFHIVEHLPFHSLQTLVAEALRVLQPGGLLILETPNPENLKVSTHTFHLDPTHQKPIPPSLLEFMTEYYGFSRSKILRLQEPSDIFEARPLTIGDVYGATSPDYSVVAQKGSNTTLEQALDDAFALHFGVSNDAVFDKYDSWITGETENTRASTAQISDKLGNLELNIQEKVDWLASKIDKNDVLFDKYCSSVDAEAQNTRALAAEMRDSLGKLQGDVQEKVGWLASKIDKIQLEAKKDAALIDFKDTVSKPDTNIRATGGVSNALSHLGVGAHAWLTLKPGSRPHRYLREIAISVRRVIVRNPVVHTAALKVLRRVPGLQLRMRKLLTPSHLHQAVFAEGQAVPRDRFKHPRNSRLAQERLSFAASQVNRQPEHIRAANPARPTLAYFSPLPPEKSGIADYSAQLLPVLAEYYQITVVTDHPDIAQEWPYNSISIKGVEWFRQNHGDFDRVVYHIGNSLLHGQMLPLLETVPGVVVLHDFYLGSLVAYLELYGGQTTVWSESLLYSHGYKALIDRSQPEKIRYAIDKYPANFDVISKASGIIVHSQHPLTLANTFYPAYSTRTWEVVPLPRVPPETVRRVESRKQIGIGDGDILVCAFGFLGPTKLNHRLLEAWLASPLLRESSCKLVYVGEAHDDPYCQSLLKRIAAECSDQVSVSGYVSRESYQHYLEAADIGVQLRTNSRGETSAAVLDCMAYGLPTIANANGSMAELPEDSVVLLNDEFSTLELSAALADLVQDDEKRKRYGSRAAAYVSENHSIKYAAERYHAAIEKFYDSSETLYDHSKLIECARQIPLNEEHARISMANTLAFTPNLPRPSKQILVDISALRTHDLRTGIQRVVRAILTSWLQMPDEQFRIQPVWLSEDGGEWRYNYAHQYTTAFLGWPRHDIPDSPVDIGEGDIFVGLDFFAHGVTEAANAGLYDDLKKRGAQIAFVVYDILPITMPHNFPAISSVVHRDWLRSISSFADKLICISNAVADDVRTWIQTERPDRFADIEIQAWHLGADIEASSPTAGLPVDGNKILHNLTDRQTFLMVGTVEPRKGYSQVLDAFELLWATGSTDALVIVGAEGWKGVPPQQARTLPALLSRLREHSELGKRLIWLEHASDEFLARIYAEADALIAASEGEGFGLPLIEAAQKGLPIIVRDIPVFREVAGNHAFYFSGEACGDLAEGIKAWKNLYANANHPLSDEMPWLTWEQSANKLLQSLRL